MPNKKNLLFGFSLFLLSLALPARTTVEASCYSISGSVTDQQKKPLSGVMITAFDVTPYGIDIAPDDGLRSLRPVDQLKV